MFSLRSTTALVFAALVTLCPGVASAASMTCPGVPGIPDPFDRQATLDPAVDCKHKEKNVKPEDIDFYYPRIENWENAGTIDPNLIGTTGTGTTGDPYVNSFLSVEFDAFDSSGSPFGVFNQSGTWSIDPAFWDSNDEAVLSIHVGGGQDSPDSWMFLLSEEDATDGILSGTFSVDCGPEPFTGCGFSNVNLWGIPTAVPIPAAAWLFGSGLIGLVVIGRRKRGLSS